MLKFDQWMLPDGERHLCEWMTKINRVVDGRLTYQFHKYEKAISYCKQRSAAVDCGAHVGLMSYWMARDFDTVDAFEPVAAHRECFVANLGPAALPEVGSVRLHGCALGDHADMIKITTAPTSSGDSRVDGAGDIPMRTLDSFDIQVCDFAKWDNEGYELFAIRGAEQTIKRCRPVIMVEQKGHGVQFHGFRKEEAAELLESWGMKRVINMSGDIVLVWPE
jgi:FkbM family methyltransferase